MDSEVTAAAAAAPGCTAKSFPSEGSRDHVTSDPTYTVSFPPLSGAHNATWANYGFYTSPVPFKFLVHNLEHGGIVIYYGPNVAPAALSALRSLRAKEPAYAVVVPLNAPQFPSNAVVATSWQRWLSCKPFSAAQISAVEVFLKTYRGTGPEPIAGSNSGGSAPGLPLPAEADKRAKQ